MVNISKEMNENAEHKREKHGIETEWENKELDSRTVWRLWIEREDIMHVYQNFRKEDSLELM